MRTISAFPRRKRKSWTGWRMTQSDANCSPASNSLIIRENTGNFRDFGYSDADFRQKKTCVFYSFSGNSLLNRTGNYFGKNREFFRPNREFYPHNRLTLTG